MDKKLLATQFKNKFETSVDFAEKRVIFIVAKIRKLEEEKQLAKTDSGKTLLQEEIDVYKDEKDELIRRGYINTNKEDVTNPIDDGLTKEEEKTLDKLTETLIKVQQRLKEIDNELKNSKN